MNKILLAFLCLFLTSTAFSQISIVENFDGGTPAGWTGDYSNSSTVPCAGNSQRVNIWSSNTIGDLVTSNQAAASNGTDIIFSLDYKIVNYDFSNPTVPTGPGWGTAEMQYSTNDGGSWTTALLIDDSNYTMGNTCTNISTTILAANVPNGSDVKLRILNTWASGDYFFYVDNFSATQIAVNPPNCDAALTSSTTSFPVLGSLTWSAATGAPTGYKLSIGSSSGGMDILAEIDLGFVTSYDASGLGLAFGTTYHALIVPYNANGDATGCTSEAFTTEPAPPSNDECANPEMLDESIDEGCAMAASGTTISASTDGTDNCSTTGKDVWYSFTPAMSGEYNFEVTETNDPGFSSTYVSLFSGSCGALTQENASCFSTSFSLNVTGGTPYLVNVRSTSSSTGVDFDVCAYPTPPPPSNDECLMATPIACDDNFIGESTVSSTDNGDAMGCFMGAGVWYEFTGVDAVVTLSVQAEAGFDHEIAVASSSDCVSFVNVDCEDFFGAGGLEEITFTSVSGTTYYFYVGHFTSATTFGSFDISVSCDFCIPATFSLSNGTNNCPTGTEFNVDVAITDLGSATTLDVTYDDGSGPVTVPNVTADITIGPFAAGATVDVTVADSADGTCSSSNSITTISVCPPVNDDCATATTIICGQTLSGETTIAATGSSGSSCNGTIGNNVWYQFTGSGETATITVTGLAGYEVQIDVYESTDGTCGTISCNAASVDPLGGNPAVATLVTTNGTVYYINIGAWTSGNGEGDFDIAIACNSCVEPTFSLSNGSNNCPTGTEFNVDVEITDLGSATTLDVTYDDGSGPVTVPNVTADISIGPFAPGATVDVTVADSADGTCSAASSITTLSVCPPANDDCSGAISLSGNDCSSPMTGNTGTATQSLAGCVGTANDDIWYSFVATTAIHTINITNVSGSTDIVTQVFDGCGGSSLICQDSPNSPIDLTGLTPTNVYFIRVYTYFNSSTEFTICVEETPPPPPGIDCSVPIDVGTLPYTETGATTSGFGDDYSGSPGSSGCGTTSPYLNGDDIVYSYTSDEDGDIIIDLTNITDNYAGVFVYSSCPDIGSACIGGDINAFSSADLSITQTGLTNGQTIYIVISTWAAPQTIGFDLSITKVVQPPANDDCATAAVLANNTIGSLIDQSFEGATDSGFADEMCNMGSTLAPADVWYSINTDADGGELTVVVEPGPNSDIVVAIYNSCGDSTPEQCVDNGGNGGIETINFTANFTGKGNISSTRDADYFVRVYEKVASGELFEIGAQGAALPIELGSFEAKAEKRGNRVQWTTLSEVNSDFVDVQSSPNGSTNWESIGQVTTKGESTSRLDYELFDFNPYEVTYYRLDAVDKDGKSELSNVINVRRSDVLGKMSVTPNPAREAISVQMTYESQGSGTINIVDMAGKIVMKRTVDLRKGLNTFNLELDVLESSGLYLITLQSEDGLQVEKFIKQ